ncbi:phosphotransferase [Clostridium sp. 'deep sea']|uniref:phosphotransferase n=1 Tax=Clostridium sp. 'deep sea' TaxID=2779445 RepID=UPI0018966AEB|nr:phosphotransferase [Clostridium sp. 'deep sea']QOR34380.1 phosphotransferase [Clostridium sp. 'deep sea']
MKILKDEYNVQNITSITKPNTGSGNTLLIATVSGKYVLKKNERDDYVAVYNKAQKHLTKKGFRQSKIVLTKDKKLKTANNYVLYEMIAGQTITDFNNKQLKNALQYLKHYNIALKSLDFCESEIKQVNNWDLAKSLNYMLNIFRKELNFYLNKQETQDILISALDYLAFHKQLLANSQKQLIHSDLGIDNFLFNEDEVVSIIDFTPEYEHEYYSLCQFYYWNFLYKENDYNHDSVNKVLFLYLNSQIKNQNKLLFNVLLLKACLFRVIGPLLNSKNEEPSAGLNKRIKLIDKVLQKIKLIK